MAGPRGMSVYERDAYIFKLLSALPIALPDNSQITRIAACAAYFDPRRDGRCAEAADLIMKHFCTIPQFVLEVGESTRGRNNFDYILNDGISKNPINLQVMLTERGSWNFHNELHIRCERLFEILALGLPSDEKAVVMQKWNVIRKIIEENSGKKWNDLPDKCSMIYEPTRNVLKETAAFLHSHGSGLMPCLWAYYYGKPILRTIFAKKNTYIQFITPPLEFDSSQVSIYNTYARAGMSEVSRIGTIKARVHTSSIDVAVSRLTTGVSFQFSDEYCKQAIIKYASPEATTHSSISFTHMSDAL